MFELCLMIRNVVHSYKKNQNDEFRLNLSTSIWFLDQIELVSGLETMAIRSGMFELGWVVILRL